MKYIEIGKITNTHGIKGELKIQSYTDFPRFEKKKKIYVKYNDEYILEEIQSSRFASTVFLVSFKGYNNINEVLKYKGCSVYIDDSMQEDLEDGFYYEDLFDKKIYNENDEFKGTVVDVIDLPQGQNLVVMTPYGKKKQIPFIYDVFILDVLEDRIIIHEIEGLL